jgi:hypothetical protein
MDQSAQYGQMNFNLPHDVVTLPSRGKFYKNKKKTLKIGYLTASDENILMAGGTLREGVVMTLLRNKIYEPDIRPEELLNGDVEAILIFLRNTSFGPTYEITATDPDTSKEFSTEIYLTELYSTDVDAEPDEDGTFQITLPKSGNSVKIRPLTLGDTQEIERMVESYPPGRIAPKQTLRLNKMIVSVDGSTDRELISKFIESMPIMDSKYIKNYIDKNEPKLDLRRQVITPSGKEISVNILFGVEFFRPFF